MTIQLQALHAAALQEARARGTAITTSLDTKGVRFGRLMVWPDGSVDTTAVKGDDADSGDVLMQLMLCYHGRTHTTVSRWRRPLAWVYVPCPACQRLDVTPYEKQAHGTQHCRCHRRDCPRTNEFG